MLIIFYQYKNKNNDFSIYLQYCFVRYQTNPSGYVPCVTQLSMLIQQPLKRKMTPGTAPQTAVR